MGKQWEDTHINRPPTGQPPPARLPVQQWKLVERPGTGLCIVVEHDDLNAYPVVAVLGRVDLKARVLYLWDQRVRKEVAVKVADLFPALSGV